MNNEQINEDVKPEELELEELELEELELSFIEYDEELDDYILLDDDGRKTSVNKRYITDEMAINSLKKKRLIREFLSILQIFLFAVVIAIVIVYFIIVNSIVPTGSMSNTIRAGDRVIGLRLAYAFNNPSRGDIIIFKFPDDEQETYIKRIIGLPGDKVEIIDGELFINDELYEEDYLKEPMNKVSYGPYNVPADSYFVMGDNRNDSGDSRYWNKKYVKKDKIIAKAIFKYWKGFSWLAN